MSFARVYYKETKLDTFSIIYNYLLFYTLLLIGIAGFIERFLLNLRKTLIQCRFILIVGFSQGVIWLEPENNGEHKVFHKLRPLVHGHPQHYAIHWVFKFLGSDREKGTLPGIFWVLHCKIRVDVVLHGFEQVVVFFELF